jgi:hypothetical protein
VNCASVSVSWKVSSTVYSKSLGRSAGVKGRWRSRRAWRDGERSFGLLLPPPGAARRLIPFAPERKLLPTGRIGNRDMEAVESKTRLTFFHRPLQIEGQQIQVT